MEDDIGISPASRVLGIEELLARILNFLPLLDLLRAQRVCQRWKATIQSSALQRSLFREVEADPPEQWVYDVEEQLIARHPCTEQQPTGRNPLKRICIVNEAVFQPPSVHQAWEKPENMRKTDVESAMLFFRKDLNIHSLSEVPLRDMFITQPPIKNARILWTYAGGSRVNELSNQNGLKILDIFDNIPKSRYPMSSWSAVDMIQLDKCHMRIEVDWNVYAPWIAVTIKERELLDDVREGHRTTLVREKQYFTP